MDKPIQMAIGVGLAIAAMAIVGVYVFGVIGGSTVSTDIVPKTLDAISSNEGKSLQISVALNNQGSGIDCERGGRSEGGCQGSV